MSKYTAEGLGYQIQKAGEEILLIIANELAEANRLKRQELVIAHLGDKPEHFKKIIDMIGDGMDV